MHVTSSAYARLAAVLPGLRVSEGTPSSGGGWVGAWELAAGGSALDGFTGQDLARLEREHGRRPRPDVAAALALHRYAWPACLLFTVPWFLHRRVPRLPVADVAVHPAGGGVTVRTRSFACLPDDPASAMDGARVLPDEAALRDELRAALAEHLTPILDAFGPRTRRGPRALWATATDEITEGLWYVARLMDREEQAVADLSALLPGGTAPYAGGAHFDSTSSSGGCGRGRLTCCLFYTVSPEGICASCPRGTDSGRIGRQASAA